VADEIVVASVNLWRHHVGAIAEDTNGNVFFEYEEAFRRTNLEISPEKLPLSLSGPITFPELVRVEAFQGLPGVFSDSLPDRFGNAIITKYFESRGRANDAMSPVQRLLYVGKRAMGALEYRPALVEGRNRRQTEALEIAHLVEQARKVVEGAPDIAVPEIMRIGSSAGGARAKAVVLWNPQDKIIRSAFAPLKDGDEHWILKFDGVGELGSPNREPAPFNRIEYVYNQMAREAGLTCATIELLEERNFAHIMIKRFDREGSKRLHMHSLGGMVHSDYNVPHAYSYEQFFRLIQKLQLPYETLEEAYRRAAFNILAVNQDDHVKNLSFLMSEKGAWSLSPAYDLTFAKGANYTRTHQMTFAGKVDGFARDDLLTVADEFGIRKRGREVVERIAEALGKWPALAKQVDVPTNRIKEIQAAFRT
jgi:serine/threonine-protein kinase HipA